ncbi:MAG: EAL domain-containing protein, partial [Pseudomonadota bacterium]|nr:EAL domain-containing protein [Pseudomonadota bacterium]
MTDGVDIPEKDWIREQIVIPAAHLSRRGVERLSDSHGWLVPDLKQIGLAAHELERGIERLPSYVFDNPDLTADGGAMFCPIEWYTALMPPLTTIATFAVQMLEDLNETDLGNLAVPLSDLADAAGRFSMRVHEIISTRGEEVRLHRPSGGPTFQLQDSRHLHERLEIILSDASMTHRRYALVFVHFLRLELVETIHGQNVLARIIIEYANRLARIEGVTNIARFGRATLALIARVDSIASKFDNITRQVTRVVEDEIELEGIDILLETRLGICLFPSEVDDVSDIIRRARFALGAPRRGMPSRKTAQDRRCLLENASLEVDFKTAFTAASEDIYLVYQPKIHIRTGQMTGMEALVRWRHDTRGLLAPDAFLPIVRELGLMYDFSRFVIERALRQIKRWQKAGIAPVPVSVNLAATDLANEDIAAMIDGLLAEHEAGQGLLEIEIGEPGLLTNLKKTRRAIQLIRDRGVKVAIDDLGTAYTSLEYLAAVVVDRVKIDRTF